MRRWLAMLPLGRVVCAGSHLARDIPQPGLVIKRRRNGYAFGPGRFSSTAQDLPALLRASLTLLIEILPSPSLLRPPPAASLLG